MAEEKVPTQFKELSTAELRRTAIEDFAVDVKEGDNKALVLAALTEAGVTWSDYAAQHPEVRPDPAAGVVTSPQPVSNQALKADAAESTEIVTYQQPVFRPNDKLLVKMERTNPLFEIRGHRFTRDNPYALVSANDAEFILREDGFRQAMPSELQEYYG